MDTFDICWLALSERFRCDDIGGAEYERCRAEWEAHGELLACLTFIVRTANENPNAAPFAEDLEAAERIKRESYPAP